MLDPYDDQVQQLVAELESSPDWGENATAEYVAVSGIEIAENVRTGLMDLEQFDAQLRVLGLPVEDVDASLEETSQGWGDDVGTHRSGEEVAPGLGVEYAGRYRIEKQLGTGGFGAVYLAEDTELSRQVAIKMPHKGSEVGRREDLFKEARACAALEHPHIVPIYDVGTTSEGIPFLVMKYMDGSSLRDLMQTGSFSTQGAAEIVSSIADAVAHAHRAGFVHRDLKPENILFDESGVPHVTDFGLAFHEEERWEQEGQRCGTLAYMAPEQIRKEAHRIDGRVDIWALGVILYEMLTKNRPFHGKLASQLSDDILNRDIRPPRQIDHNVPESLQEICIRCCEKDPGNRYASAADIAAGLRKWIASKSRSRSRLPFAVGGLAVTGILILGLFTLPIFSPRSAESKPDPLPEISAELELFVNAPDDPFRQVISARLPRALPVVTGDQIRIEAKLNRPAYAYLIWIDTEGVAIPLYPWKDFAWSERRNEVPVDELNWPAETLSFQPLEGVAGTETICLLTRDTPLDEDFDLKMLLADIPPPSNTPMGILELVNGQLVDSRGRTNTQRGPTRETDAIAEQPVLKLQRSLHNTLKNNFEGVQMISFPNQGSRKTD